MHLKLQTVLLPLAFLTATILADSAEILASIADIQTKTLDLDTTVAQWKGPLDPLGTLPIIIKSTSLLSTIDKGTETAQNSANLTVLETLGVAQSTITLVGAVQSTLTTIVDAHDKFAHLLLTPIIWLNLKSEKAATDRFSAAVISKVPEALQALAAGIVAPVDTAFDDAIAAYAP